MAQWLAQVSYKHEVVGSSPTFTTIRFGGSEVERLTVNQRVAGSNPARSANKMFVCFKLMIIFAFKIIIN